MEFKNFTDLYLTGCKLRKEEPVQLKYFLDLDRIYEIVQQNIELKESFIAARPIMEYSYQFSHKLPPDFHNYSKDVPNIILVYPSNIMALIDIMEDNYDIYLNKWKLDRIEKVLLRGWKKYCEIHIDYCL
jgi:hypothetical protein